jgi:hypothetical protein
MSKISWKRGEFDIDREMEVNMNKMYIIAKSACRIGEDSEVTCVSVW